MTTSALIRQQLLEDGIRQSLLRFNYAAEVAAPALAEAFNARRIWLFGSSARNMANRDSDIDILVEGGGILCAKKRLSLAYDVVSSLEDLPCGIDVIVLTEEEIGQKKSVSAISSMLNDRKLIFDGIM